MKELTQKGAEGIKVSNVLRKGKLASGDES